MKNAFHNSNRILHYIFDSEKFKITFFLNIFITLYAVFGLAYSATNISEAILVTFQFPIINIIVYFVLLFNVMTVCTIFSKKMQFYIIRKNDKKEATLEIMYFSLIYNLASLIILFILFISIYIIFNGFSISNANYYNYKINYNLYMLFYIVRYIIISLLITAVNVILYQKMNNKIIAINIPYAFGLLVYQNSIGIKKIFDVIPWNYYSYSDYINYQNELFSSLLFILLLIILILIIFRMVYRGCKK